MAERKLTPRGEFDKALAERAGRFGVELDEGARARLGRYFELVAAWNPRLHLVAPCPPAEFAARHVLESLAALPFIPEGATVLDVGSGAGLPALVKWAARVPTLLLFGGESLREALEREGLSFETVRVPESERRFLFVVW